MRAISKCLFVLFVAAAVSPISISRAADPLEALPAEVDYVIRYASIDNFVGNANDMLTAIGPVAGQLAKSLEADLARGLLQYSDDATVFDRKSPLYVAGFVGATGANTQQNIFLVKSGEKNLDALYKKLMTVDDLKEIERKPRGNGFVELATDGRRCFAAQRGDCLLYTFNPKAFEALKDFDPKKATSLAAAMKSKAKKPFEEGDAAVWVNVPRLAQRYKDDLENVREQTIAFIKALSQEELGVANAEKAKKLYTQLAEALFDSVHDTTWAVAAVNLGPKGGAATVLLGFKKDSPADKLLAANPPLPLENLELLPAKAPIYVGMRMSYSGLGEALLATNYGNDPADSKATAAALELLRNAELQSTVSSMTIPTEGKHGMVTTTLEEAKDAAKLRQGWAAYLKAISEVKTPVIAQKFEYTDKAEKHKNHVIDLFKTEFKITTDDAEAEAILNAFFARMFGGMNFQTRLTTVENLLVQTTGNDPKFIREVLDRFDSGEDVLGLEKPYAQTRDRLSGKANFLMLLNAPQLVVDSVAMVKQVEPFGTLLGFTSFNFAIKPPISYAGISVATEPQALRVQLFVPVEQPRGILQIFMPGI